MTFPWQKRRTPWCDSFCWHSLKIFHPKTKAAKQKSTIFSSIEPDAAFHHRLFECCLETCSGLLTCSKMRTSAHPSNAPSHRHSNDGERAGFGPTLLSSHWSICRRRLAGHAHCYIAASKLEAAVRSKSFPHLVPMWRLKKWGVTQDVWAVL